MGLFDEKVVVITGAGGGIGRAHALSFAREGAKLVVNDLGTQRNGSGSSTSMANLVVNEIKQLSGEAVANYDDVVNGGVNIINTALENYGKIDILINNAGILRDKTLVKMEDENWDKVLDIHLRGTFSCTKAAAKVMIEQGTGGSIINTTSLAGLVGNFGQANYSSAKAGIYGFTKTVALELERYNITVNCIAPMAKTRLTEDIDGVPAKMTPEQVTPMVLFLASDKARNITGRIFGIHGQHLFEYQMKSTPGVEKEGDKLWTVDEITKKFEAITTFPEISKQTEQEGPSIDDVFPLMPQIFVPEEAEGWETTLHFELTGADDWCVTVHNGTVSVSKEIPQDPRCVIKMSSETLLQMIKGSLDPTKAFMTQKIKASRLPELVKFDKAFSLEKLTELIQPSKSESDTSEDQLESGLDPKIIGRTYEGSIETVEPEKTMAYAKATNETNPRYYEADENRLAIPPLYPVTMLVDPMKQIVMDDTLNLDIFRMVHGEQEILYHRPLRPWDKIKTKVELESIDVKEAGDILWAKILGQSYEELVFEMRAGMFFRRPRTGIRIKKKEEKIEREIIVSKQMKVTSDQSVRYAAASGDDNPIHVDKDVAMTVGLPDIILHGLCTLAFATQAVVDELADGDPTKVKQIKTRFSKPVLMDSMLTTKAWLMEEDETSKTIAFETKNENGEAVLKFGSVKLLK